MARGGCAQCPAARGLHGGRVALAGGSEDVDSAGNDAVTLLSEAAFHDVADRTLDSHVSRMRRKLRDAGCDPVTAVRGVGYRLDG